MLKSIDPVLSADLLWVLAAMGHGDDLALVDANHPAERIARSTASGRVIRLPGLPMARVARAILSVLPIDDFTPDPIRRMEVVDDPAAWPEVQRQVEAEVAAVLGQSTTLHGIERFAFYEAAKASFAVVQVGDPRPYGCFLFRKGVVAGDEETLRTGRGDGS
ncbi:MAG: RbsD/FucU domain-containing protein [Rhodopila sp.]|nr:RbsD/FucU domain-containing protein [Rhodopila sp.]